VLTGVAPGAEAARALAWNLFGDRVLAIPDAAIVRDGGEKDRRPNGLDNTVPSRPHTDGFAYGDRYPDHFLLSCDHHCAVGGQSFLLDGYAILDAIAADPAIAWVATALEQVAIDQTEEGMQPSISPIVQRAPSGRLMLRNTYGESPAPDSADPERDAEMIRIWKDTIWEAASSITAAERPRIVAGEAVIIDNYRMFHGREAFADVERLMWRVWVWTESGAGVPDGLLHSDSRYAWADPTATA
jgi:gamma-butyrobetaine dioxygenase